MRTAARRTWPLLLAALALAGAGTDAFAQRTRRPVARASALTACSGERVSAIEIRVHRPAAASAATEVWDKASEISRMHVNTTRERVVRSYLQMHEGQACIEIERRESERLLRAQPFIASAAIRVVPDSAGSVRLQVDVVDEVSFILGGSISRGTLSSLSVGSQNVQGRGLLTTLNLSRGFAYRTGVGLKVVQYGAFGRPDLVGLDVAREQHGDRLVFEVAEPFLTELQRSAFHLSAGSISDLTGLMPPSGDGMAIFTRRAFWDAGLVTRLGKPARGRTVGVVGALVMGEDIRTGSEVVIVSDSGLVPASDTVLPGRYPAYGVARVAAIAGVRHLRYLTVDGFDALYAEQDVGVGVQLGVLAGPSVWASRSQADMLMAADLYAGVGSAASFYAVHLLTEVRATQSSHHISGAVSSLRLSWYSHRGYLWTSIATIEGAALHDLSFPAQLSLRDADGGVRGFGDAAASGGQRLVARVEQRLRLPPITRRAALAVAMFADAGRIWAGDAPYAAGTPVRASLGLSLLGAYPSAGKRTLRVDFAVPLNPAPGDPKFEVRLSSADRTRGIWREPRDVTRVRTGAMPATLLKW